MRSRVGLRSSDACRAPSSPLGRYSQQVIQAACARPSDASRVRERDTAGEGARSTTGRRPSNDASSPRLRPPTSGKSQPGRTGPTMLPPVDSRRPPQRQQLLAPFLPAITMNASHEVGLLKVRQRSFCACEASPKGQALPRPQRRRGRPRRAGSSLLGSSPSQPAGTDLALAMTLAASWLARALALDRYRVSLSELCRLCCSLPPQTGLDHPPARRRSSASAPRRPTASGPVPLASLSTTTGARTSVRACLRLMLDACCRRGNPACPSSRCRCSSVLCPLLSSPLASPAISRVDDAPLVPPLLMMTSNFTRCEQLRVRRGSCTRPAAGSRPLTLPCNRCAALVGTLRSAKRSKVITYESEMLLQVRA